MAKVRKDKAAAAVSEDSPASAALSGVQSDVPEAPRDPPPPDDGVPAVTAEPEGQTSSAEPSAASAAEDAPAALQISPSDQPAPVWILLSQLSSSTRFRLRQEGDVETLATSIVRDGQLFPIDVRVSSGDASRFEVICGFRRTAALRLLMRRRVLAVVHEDLSDADALALALESLLESKSADKAALEELRARLRTEGRLTPQTDELLTRAISPEELELSPETIDCAQPAPDPCALVDRLLSQLGSVNQDLSQLARCWDAIPREVREVILQQLSYSSEMARYFRRLPGGLF